MIFKVMTQKGEAHSGEIEYVVIKNEDGELAILDDHIPIILQIKKGHLKLVNGKEDIFLVIEQGVVEFKNNELIILALDVQRGSNLEEAETAFSQMKKDRLEMTKKENVDFSKYERDLKENIAKGKAGQL